MGCINVSCSCVWEKCGLFVTMCLSLHDFNLFWFWFTSYGYIKFFLHCRALYACMLLYVIQCNPKSMSMVSVVSIRQFTCSQSELFLSYFTQQQENYTDIRICGMIRSTWRKKRESRAIICIDSSSRCDTRIAVIFESAVTPACGSWCSVLFVIEKCSIYTTLGGQSICIHSVGEFWSWA
jgi:hypothetical protein